MTSTEGAAHGAALLAGVGVYRDVPTACDAAIRITGRVQPGPPSQVYADDYPRYRALYPALKPTFDRLTQ